MPMRELDAYLLDLRAAPNLSGLRRAAAEFAWFGIKEVRACLFAGLFFAAVFAVPRSGVLGVPRYDLLLLNLRELFTHHFIPDYRWYLAACALGMYARTTVVFRPLDRDRTMPLVVAFVLIGFFIWLAENVSTFFGIWAYPNQVGAWARVHVGKWSSWSLLVIMTFTIVANLKHIKERIHVPE